MGGSNETGRWLGELRRIRGLAAAGGSPAELHGALARLRGNLAQQGTLQQLAGGLRELYELGRRRLAGDYPTDEFGTDPLYRDGLRPVFHWFYRHYFRAVAQGVDRVPSAGPVLLVCNHAGIIFWDGAMVLAALDLEHPCPRPMRGVFLSWFAHLPFVAPLLARCGHVQASPENTLELLQRGELVAVFPEGMKGAGKLYRDRYQLERFGRGGFVKVALEAGAKVVPTAIVGAEETYPMFFRLGGRGGRFLGLPFLPVTPTFPWLGPLGLVPLPSRFRIRFHEPIDYGKTPPQRARDFTFIDGETERIRALIQASLDELRVQRGHPYFDLHSTGDC